MPKGERTNDMKLTTISLPWPAFAAVVLAALVLGFAGGRAVPSPSTPSASPSSAPSAAPSASARPEPQKFDIVEDPHFRAGLPLRPMDKQIFETLMNGSLDRNSLADLFPSLPFHVRVVGSVTERRFGLVMIDLERDGKWDERWPLKGSEVERYVLSDGNVDGKVGIYTLAHGRWQPR